MNGKVAIYGQVAIYARVSTRDQHCEVQLKELREYCKRRGWKKPLEYVDEGVSGTKASRPALDKLMRDAADGQFGTVLVSKLDRFGRSVLNLSEQIHRLDAYKIRFIATSQGIDTDRANPVTKLLLNILSSVAEFEREIICERTRAGLQRARELGKVLGRRKKVFRRDLVEGMRAQGLSWRKIGKRLGVSTSTVFASVAQRSAEVRIEKRSEIPIRQNRSRSTKQSVSDPALRRSVA